MTTKKIVGYSMKPPNEVMVKFQSKRDTLFVGYLVCFFETPHCTWNMDYLATNCLENPIPPSNPIGWKSSTWANMKFWFLPFLLSSQALLKWLPLWQNPKKTATWFINLFHHQRRREEVVFHKMPFFSPGISKPLSWLLLNRFPTAGSQH